MAVHLLPLQWDHDDSAFFFMRVADEIDYYRLVLDQRLWSAPQTPQVER